MEVFRAWVRQRTQSCVFWEAKTLVEGLHPSLLRSLTLQGYRIPTPIQRLAIPALLETPPRDLVGMARTGSGKSLAYMVPLVQKLGGIHQTAFGARALILLPTRELAVQILKVGKELARGWHRSGDHAGDKGDAESSKTQALRWGLVVGGEGLDEQFEMITNNPDMCVFSPSHFHVPSFNSFAAIVSSPPPVVCCILLSK